MNLKIKLIKHVILVKFQSFDLQFCSYDFGNQSFSNYILINESLYNFSKPIYRTYHKSVDTYSLKFELCNKRKVFGRTLGSYCIPYFELRHISIVWKYYSLLFNILLFNILYYSYDINQISIQHRFLLFKFSNLTLYSKT